MSFAEKNAQKALEWAEKRKRQQERAAQLRASRKVGVPSDEHTFAPSTNVRPASRDVPADTPNFNPSIDSSSHTDLPWMNPASSTTCMCCNASVSSQVASSSPLAADPPCSHSHPTDHGTHGYAARHGGYQADGTSYAADHAAKSPAPAAALIESAAPAPAMEAHQTFSSLLRGGDEPARARGGRPAWNSGLDDDVLVRPAASRASQPSRRSPSRGQPAAATAAGRPAQPTTRPASGSLQAAAAVRGRGAEARASPAALAAQQRGGWDDQPVGRSGWQAPSGQDHEAGSSLTAARTPQKRAGVPALAARDARGDSASRTPGGHTGAAHVVAGEPWQRPGYRQVVVFDPLARPPWASPTPDDGMDDSVEDFTTIATARDPFVSIRSGATQGNVAHRAQAVRRHDGPVLAAHHAAGEYSAPQPVPLYGYGHDADHGMGSGSGILALDRRSDYASAAMDGRPPTHTSSNRATSSSSAAMDADDTAGRGMNALAAMRARRAAKSRGGSVTESLSSAPQTARSAATHRGEPELGSRRATADPAGRAAMSAALSGAPVVPASGFDGFSSADAVLGGPGQGVAPGVDVPEQAPAEPLHPCPSCGRKFRAAALEKHTKICQKVFVAKRKQFDSSKDRVPAEAQALATGGPGAGHARHGARARGRARPAPVRGAPSRVAAAAGGGRPGPAGGAAGGKTEWKAKSNQLRQAMKASRMMKAAEAKGIDVRTLDLPDVPTAGADNFVPCPHCGRTFNPTAAERHIPRCSSIKAKPSRLVKGGGVGMHSGRRR